MPRPREHMLQERVDFVHKCVLSASKIQPKEVLSFNTFAAGSDKLSLENLGMC